jgi:hypothetical protein
MSDQKLANAAREVSYSAHKLSRSTDDPQLKKLAQALEDLADALVSRASKL